MFSLTKKFELSADADESVMCQTLPIQFCSLLEMMYYLLTGSGLVGGGALILQIKWKFGQTSCLQSSPYNEQNCRLEDKTEIGSEVQNDKTFLITSFQST